MKKIYYYPLECELKKHRMTKTDLQYHTGLSSTTIAKIGKNEDISLKALKSIAEVLDCNIADLVTFDNVYVNKINGGVKNAKDKSDLSW